MLARRTPMKRGSGFARKLPARAPREERVIKPVTPRPPGSTVGVIGRAGAQARAVPKQPRERCQHLLDMAEGKPCQFWFVPGCKRWWDTSTTVKAHDNRLSSNKGKGYKAHDWASVDACDQCHFAYDQGSDHTREEKNAAFDAALERQMEFYRQILANPCAREKDRKAARWALHRYEFHKIKGDLS